jgi:predicted nucleic acid-binding protein
VIVIDASVMANVVADDADAGALTRARVAVDDSWVVPDLVDVETVAVLRKRWRAGDLTARRFRSAVEDLLALPMVRVPTGPLMLRAHEWRSNITPYDAAYVALAESLSCVLFTADARLSGAPGVRCDIELISP